MDERNKLVILYDYYGNLLSDSQQTYFEDYYFNNLSLGEISENMKVSRNAIHKQLKVSCNKLLEYEEKLNFMKKSNELRKYVDKIQDNEIRDKLIQLLEN